MISEIKFERLDNGWVIRGGYTPTQYDPLAQRSFARFVSTPEEAWKVIADKVFDLFDDETKYEEAFEEIKEQWKRGELKDA